MRPEIKHSVGGLLSDLPHRGRHVRTPCCVASAAVMRSRDPIMYAHNSEIRLVVFTLAQMTWSWVPGGDVCEERTRILGGA